MNVIRPTELYHIVVHNSIIEDRANVLVRCQ
jgi:hypothetical protein